MDTNMHEWVWIDPQRSVGQADLALACGLSATELDQLVSLGGLVPLQSESGAPLQFPGSCVAALREVVRLRAKHSLDLFTVSLLLGYLHRILQLEHQVRALQPAAHAQLLPREGPSPWREPHA
jgi:chaperone modulatory protein CbpM